MPLLLGREGHRVVVTVTDRLDGGGASQLLAVLARVASETGDELVVDVAHVRDLEPSAFAVLARSGLGPRLRWRGLSQHHQRVLELLGTERSTAADP